MRVRNTIEIGQFVRDARTRARISQSVLADRIGASRFWVADLERGKPTVELELVLRALHALKLAITIVPEVPSSQTMTDATPRTTAESRGARRTVNLAEHLRQFDAHAREETADDQHLE